MIRRVQDSSSSHQGNLVTEGRSPAKKEKVIWEYSAVGCLKGYLHCAPSNMNDIRPPRQGSPADKQVHLAKGGVLRRRKGRDATLQQSLSHRVALWGGAGLMSFQSWHPWIFLKRSQAGGLWLVALIFPALAITLSIQQRHQGKHKGYSLARSLCTLRLIKYAAWMGILSLGFKGAKTNI